MGEARLGNHAQALALAARESGIPAHIVMPTISNPKKIAATQGYGATVHFSGSTAAEREEVADRVIRETGARLVPPYDHPDVILGQGWSSRERPPCLALCLFFFFLLCLVVHPARMGWGGGGWE